MRKYKLTNSAGQELDLNDLAHFFMNPSGLGFVENIQSLPAGTDFIKIWGETQQPIIQGEMKFRGYENYEKFAEFIAYPPLRLHYCPHGSKWYYIDCEVQRIDKGELNGVRQLISAVDFLCYGIWRESVTVNRTLPSLAEGKIYPYTYNYDYRELSAGAIELTNNKPLPAPCRIHIFGEAENPSWALVKDGEIIADGAVTVTIEAGKKLVVDSTPGALEIAEYTVNNEYVRSLYAYSDFSKKRFIMIPQGTSILTFTHAGAGELTALVEVIQLAKTV